MNGNVLHKARDLTRAVTLAPAMPILRPVVQPRLRPMSIKAALEWAFGAEHADLDLDNAPEWHVGTDTIWRLMRNGALGCRVDGGGRSLPATDADIIASFVAALPVAQGGKGMAVQIAALARAGIAPDWLQDDRPRVVPRAWRHGNQWGRSAQVDHVAADNPAGWGRIVPFCPITWTPSAVQVASARRGWLAWWGALHHLAHELRGAGLETVLITHDMPPRAPWNTRG